MNDKVITATASVIVIACTLSLLNIYILPNMMYKVDVVRNAATEDQSKILSDLENIDLSSELFDSFNITNIYFKFPTNIIMNISFMIEQVKEHKSGAYDVLVAKFQNATINSRAKRASLEYNGTISFVENNTTKFVSWVNTIFNDKFNATYFVIKETNGQYSSYCNITGIGSQGFTLTDVELGIYNLFNNSSLKPLYVVYQSLNYTENRGLLRDYTTQFQRLAFVDAFGEINFFLTNEGRWDITSPEL